MTEIEKLVIELKEALEKEEKENLEAEKMWSKYIHLSLKERFGISSIYLNNQKL